jgi:hypothetical protein
MSLPDADGKKAEKPKKHWLDYATFGVEILGLAGLAIYACLTRGIYTETQKAANAAKNAADTAHDAYVASYQPRVLIKGLSFNTAVTSKEPRFLYEDRRIGFTADVVNYGTADALHVQYFQAWALIGREANAHRLPYELVENPADVIRPKIAEVSTQTVFFSSPLSAAQIAGVQKSPNDWIEFSVLIVYQDSFGGKLHHAEFCQLASLTPENSVCPWAVRND